MVLLGVLNNAGGRVPARLTNRIPPGRISLITEHDNVPWCVAVSLLHFLLDLPDTALKDGDGGITLIQWYVVTVPMKIVSAGVNRNVLEVLIVNANHMKVVHAHRGYRFVLGNIKYGLQVMITDGLKPLRPTEMLEDEPPGRANVEIIFEGL